MEARLQNALMRLPHERPMERISVRLKQHGDVTFRLFSKIMPYGYFMRLHSTLVNSGFAVCSRIEALIVEVVQRI